MMDPKEKLIKDALSFFAEFANSFPIPKELLGDCVIKTTVDDFNLSKYDKEFIIIDGKIHLTKSFVLWLFAFSDSTFRRGMNNNSFPFMTYVKGVDRCIIDLYDNSFSFEFLIIKLFIYERLQQNKCTEIKF